MDPAGAQNIVVTATIYVTGTAAGLASAASAACQEYLASIPIGGTNGATNGEVPLSGFYSALQSISPNITEIDIAAPSSNIGISVGFVPVLDPSSSFAIVVVPVA